jgi:insertion element IS1 protein InsB
MTCPRCGSARTVKNGRIHHGQAKRLCKDCRRQFVPDATKKVISPQTWELINKLLLERIPLAGIARVTGISENYLQAYVNRKYALVPREVRVRTPKKGG